MQHVAARAQAGGLRAHARVRGCEAPLHVGLDRVAARDGPSAGVIEYNESGEAVNRKRGPGRERRWHVV
jgi:hypothetical protein